MNNKQKFIASEFGYIFDNVKPEEMKYLPKLQITHCGNKTKHIDITWEQFDAIRQFIIDTSESE